MTAALHVDRVTVDHPLADGRRLRAVDEVSVRVDAGTTLGIVGESGCGKSSLANAILHLPPPTSGRVVLGDTDLTALDARELRRQRPRIQMLQQDPIASLNPRRRVGALLAEPLRVWRPELTRAERVDRVRAGLDAVGIDPDAADRRPHEFSGGQCQRIGLARALMLDPDVLVCDEPVSALDVSVQAQVLDVLRDLQRRRDLTMVFIAHDVAVVRSISDRIAVMYLGALAEVVPAATVVEERRHHYTAALLRSVPLPDPTVTAPGASLVGDPPSPVDVPSGCRFRTRCDAATGRCASEVPALADQPAAATHLVACHHPLEPGAREP